MKKFRIEMPYEGKRIMEVSANSEEEALKIFREKDYNDRVDDILDYVEHIIDLEEGNGQVVEIEDVREHFESLCEIYKNKHGVMPRFAEVTIRYKGDTDEQCGMIVCFDKDLEIEADSPDDKVLFFHFDGQSPVDDMFGDGEDFDIVSVEDVMYEL